MFRSDRYVLLDDRLEDGASYYLPRVRPITSVWIMRVRRWTRRAAGQFSRHNHREERLVVRGRWRVEPDAGKAESVQSAEAIE